MAIPVEAPKLGNTVEECLVSRWAKHKGEQVAAGDVVAEIETDKATFEVTAPVDGVVLDTFFEEGALVPVFTNLFVIGAVGEDIESLRPGSATPRIEAPVEAPLSAGTSLDAADTGTCAARISPRARRFARENHVDATGVNGSGPGGRVLEQDLRKIYDSATRMSTMRERIARRMRESLTTTAQYTMHASADARGLLAARARVKRSTSLPDININELVTFCTVEALLEIPDLNAEFSDGRIRKHADIHVGFACDTPRGLLVPVVRDAHTLAVDELAIRMKDLAARAVEGKLSPDDLSGATFTISNLGGLGVNAFTPILNPPQVAILGVGAIQLKPVRNGGQIEFIDTIGLSLTCDHQVIDGAPGARFLKVLAARIAQVESIF